MSKEKNTREWISYIDMDVLQVFPIQFVNCDRLEANDAVYIFDEVGAGKTITSGIMAMDYLEKHPDEKVLIITTNALVKGGQFLKDCYEKLPFQTLGYDKKIVIKNNIYTSFKEKESYGLVMIDEAHLFLNPDSQRYQNLVSNIRAKKVAVLTATPIKDGIEDLGIYVDIADALTSKCNGREWIKEIDTKQKEENALICGTFRVDYPVTRYFKDTIQSLKYDGFQKTKAKRCLPHLWSYTSVNEKKEVMLKHMEEALAENGESRFVVFTRFVESEAYEIKEFLVKNGFVSFAGQNAGEKSVAVVTGDNKYELEKYKGNDGAYLPTVLILTYQIAEQGVNLPGFNYVVNYHISAFSSSLEQRFGRIDRMGKSTFDEIHMSFLISDNYWDTNTGNFYRAVAGFIKTIISYLPSKNIVLSEEILEKYRQKKNLLDEYVERMEKLLQSEEEMNHLISYLEKDEETSEKVNPDLLEFVQTYADGSPLIEKEELKKALKEELRELRRDMGSVSEENIEKCKNIIRKASDKIFYLHEEDEVREGEGIRTVSALDCAENIKEDADYKKYREEFAEEVKTPILLQDYLLKINQYFEEAFLANEFYKLFPTEGGEKILEEAINSKLANIPKEDRKALLSHCAIVIACLPFYLMCKEFQTIIQSYSEYDRFDYNPFIEAVKSLGAKVQQSGSGIRLSESFVQKFWSSQSDTGCYFDCFKMEQKEDGRIEATNWYKLSYWYTGLRDFNEKRELSLFRYYLLTESLDGKVTPRAYTKWMYKDIREAGKGTPKVLARDIWTQGILYDICGIRF